MARWLIKSGSAIHVALKNTNRFLGEQDNVSVRGSGAGITTSSSATRVADAAGGGVRIFEVGDARIGRLGFREFTMNGVVRRHLMVARDVGQIPFKNPPALLRSWIQ